jgi:hypothetical protein
MSSPEAASPDSVASTSLVRSFHIILADPSKYIGNEIDLSIVPNSAHPLTGNFTYLKSEADRYNDKTGQIETFQIWQSILDLKLYKVLVVGDAGMSIETPPIGIWSKDAKGGYFIDARKSAVKIDTKSNAAAETNQFSEVSF